MPLVDPHGGGDLTPLLLEDDALVAERKRAAGLAKVRVSSREKGDLMMLGIVMAWMPMALVATEAPTAPSA